MFFAVDYHLIWHVNVGHSLHEAGKELVVGAAGQSEGPQGRIEGPQLPSILLVDLSAHEKHCVLYKIIIHFDF
jgi:hypothetical protein